MSGAPQDGATPTGAGAVGDAMLSTIRARLLAMLLLVALPLFAFGAATSWENYQDVSALVGRQLQVASAAATATAVDAMNAVRQRLQVVASLPGVRDGPPAACDALLAQVLRLEQPRYGAFALLDGSGQLRCGTNLEAFGGRAQMLATATRPGGGDFLVGDPTAGPGATLPARLRVVEPGFSGVISTSVSMDWLAHRERNIPRVPQQVTALLDSHDRTVPFGTMTQAPMATGELFEPRTQFRVSQLPGGLRLLVGTPVMPRLLEARRALIQRLSALGLLLAAGLAAMAAGIGVTVVRPVRQLSAAVARWREGGSFKPGSVSHAPREIAALSLSFGRAVAALDQREVQLREAGTQQELLMQEIHHRVKNNLQIVASLLNLQASRIKLPEARAEFQAARDRIRALATLHRHLYAYGELHTINMRSFLIELCSQLLQALGETAAGGRIKLDIEAPELRISSDQAVPMALIVTEAVSNAAKYAFPGGRSGHIAVRLLVIDEGAAQETLRLTIEDDGVGIVSQPRDTPTEARSGIGTHLIRGFAKQLQATMTLTHDGGTSYVLDIPTRRGNAAAPEAIPEG